MVVVLATLHIISCKQENLSNFNETSDTTTITYDQGVSDREGRICSLIVSNYSGTGSPYLWGISGINGQISACNHTYYGNVAITGTQSHAISTFPTYFAVKNTHSTESTTVYLSLEQCSGGSGCGTGTEGGYITISAGQTKCFLINYCSLTEESPD